MTSRSTGSIPCGPTAAVSGNPTCHRQTDGHNDDRIWCGKLQTTGFLSRNFKDSFRFPQLHSGGLLMCTPQLPVPTSSTGNAKPYNDSSSPPTSTETGIPLMPEEPVLLRAMRTHAFLHLVSGATAGKVLGRHQIEIVNEHYIQTTRKFSRNGIWGNCP